jgi:hypothetical protein
VDSVTVILGSWNNIIFGGSLDIETGTVYMAAAAAANAAAVDVFLSNEATGGIFVMSPKYAASQGHQTMNWATQNETTFKKTSLSDISGAATIREIYDKAAGTESQKQQVYPGDIIVVRTVHGNYALLVILTVVEGNNGSAAMTVLTEAQ